MSFLPYGKTPATTWVLSIGGSSVLHTGLVGAILTSSVALMPDPIVNTPRTPDFEITLEILDAEIIEEPVEDSRFEIPEDAVALAPDSSAETLAEADLDASLLQQADDDTLLAEAEALTDALVPDDETALAQEDIEAEDLTVAEEALQALDAEPDQRDAVIEALAPDAETPLQAEVEAPLVQDNLEAEDLTAPAETLQAVVAEPDLPETQPETQPEAQPETLPEALTEAQVEAPIDALAPESETPLQAEAETPIAEPLAPVEAPVTPTQEVPQTLASNSVLPTPAAPSDTLAIDDISPIGESEISPLAKAVAPALIAPVEAITLPDDGPIATDTAALLLPEPRSPLPQPSDTVLQPEPVAIAPEPTTPVAQPEPVALLPEPTNPVAQPEPVALLPEPTNPVAQPEPVAIEPTQSDPVVAPEATLPEQTDPVVLAPSPEPTPEPNAPQAVEEPAVIAPSGTSDPRPQQIIENPGQDTVMIGTLLGRIRGAPSAQCQLALPRRVGADRVGVSFIGSQSDQLDQFAARLLDGLSPLPVQTREILDPRQCAMLDAVRQISDYPAGRIGLSLESATLQSGENLRGRIVGSGGMFVTLLLIDDNGVVQDMGRFTTLENGDPVFDAPIARSGPSRETRQVLLALGSQQELPDLAALFGQEAETVFTQLPIEVLSGLRFGLTTFDVQ